MTARTTIAIRNGIMNRITRKPLVRADFWYFFKKIVVVFSAGMPFSLLPVFVADAFVKF